MQLTRYLFGSGVIKGYAFAVFAFAAIAIACPQVRGYAQSTNKVNPTPVRSKEITGLANYPIPTDGSWGKVFYYEFMAGPGEMSATAITRGRGDRVQYNISFEEAGGSSLGQTLGLLGGPAERRMSKSYLLSKRMPVVMTVKLSSHFDYQIILDGAVDIPRAGTNSGQDEEGPIMRLPNRGTLLIRMRDGTTREIDLSLVKELRIIDR